MACSFIFTGPNDSLANLATRCGISEAAFTTYNPSIKTFGESLLEGVPVCCTVGTAPDLSDLLGTAAVNLTSSSTELTAREHAGHWQAALYSEKDCSGDYYSLEGYSSSQYSSCLSPIQSNMPTSSRNYGITCRFFTNGGASWSPCGEGTLVNPRSYWAKDLTICSAYKSNGCSETALAYFMRGCQNRDSDEDVRAIRCIG